MFVIDCPIEMLTVPWVSPCEPNELTCALPDLNQDGVVDVVDWLDLLALWGPADCTVFKRGDLNMDEEVDIFDMLILLQAWGGDPLTWDRCDC